MVAHFQPATVVQEGRAGGVRLRRGLVVTQFTTTTALLTMTLLMWHQLDYIQNLLRENSAIGFEPEQVVVVENRGLTLDQARAFKTELLQDSRIAAVSLSSTIFGGPQINYGIESEGVAEPVFMRMYGVDGDFVEIMGLHLAQGPRPDRRSGRCPSSRHQQDRRAEDGVGRAAGQDNQSP